MRIENTRGTSSVNKSEKSRKSGSSDGVFGSFLEGESSQAQGATPGLASQNIGALLAAQYEDEDVLEKQRSTRMLRRANHMLSTLDDIQKALMLGGLNLHDLNRLKAGLSVKREALTDPKLQEILNELDLRAAVELAKLEIARDKTLKS